MQLMMKKIKEIDKNKIEIIFLVLIIIALAIMVGLNRIVTSDFNPTNGDWQNYNPVRRVLAGQIPYKDFSVYLGSGHLILLSFFQLILGNNFTISLFITNMCTFLFFELTTFIVSFLVLQNKNKALYITLGMALFNIVRFNSVIKFNNEISSALDFALKPGNSARLIRIGIAPILVAFVYLGYRYFDRLKQKNIVHNANLFKKIYIAIISGLAIVWSNDGGIASYIAISFIYFILLIKEYKTNVKSILKYTIMYILISLIATFILILIITRGNFTSWLEFTLGVSSYQKWYYEKAYVKENLSLLDLDKSFFNIAMIIIAIYYIYKLLKVKNKKQTLQYAMLGFMVISSIISAYLYQILSGGTSKDMLVLILLILIVNYLVLLFQKIFKYKTICISDRTIITIKKGTAVLTSGIIVISLTFSFINVNKYKDAVYIEELGGRFTQYGESIKYAVDRIGDEKIFSTYSTAIEGVTGQFQPSGSDYIIHSLGDKQRNEYLESFKNGNYKYATIIEQSSYRWWMQGANWFFYKELYKNYKPSFSTLYNIFYEKKKDGENITSENIDNVEIEISKISDSEYYIILQTANKNFNGIADVKIKYDSEYCKSFFETLNINKYVCVEGETINMLTGYRIDDYNIPDEDSIWNIPITIINGEGKVKISSYPVEDTKLKLEEVEVCELFDVMFRYCNASASKTSDENTLLIYKTKEKEIIMEDAKAIKIGDVTRKIIKYSEDDRYIILELDGTAEEFAYPNYFEVIK